jgi:hypothetical protein
VIRWREFFMGDRATGRAADRTLSWDESLTTVRALAGHLAAAQHRPHRSRAWAGRRNRHQSSLWEAPTSAVGVRVSDPGPSALLLSGVSNPSTNERTQRPEERSERQTFELNGRQITRAHTSETQQLLAAAHAGRIRPVCLIWTWVIGEDPPPLSPRAASRRRRQRRNRKPRNV